ncbi:hypothetical protein FIBSPDRAFT_1041283 [Athelia psychrophila]|uniref:F-box domain-containing protein n=1 Tax=Athelia psychrophila TaxID=1759441 RepID=A0A166P2Y5_9AGAM|nr:hypothetical protein FIBSPDRAFT_1041283 [Fibularhizoctonia sp. CBS 109695]
MRGAELVRYRPIIAVLLAHSHHWENLFMIESSMGLRRIAHEELQGAKGRLSMLRRLKVDYGNIEEWGSLDTFLTLPKLRIVDLRNSTVPGWHETGQFPLLPWRQLQQITFTGRVQDALELLRMSPSLQVFKASTWGRSEGPYHVHHAFLRELTLCIARFAGDFIEKVTLPALVSLSYESRGDGFPARAISSFVERSGISQSLQTLSLELTHDEPGDISIDISHIAGCFKSMPGLSQLFLHDESKRKYTVDDSRYGHNLCTGDIGSICEAILAVYPAT